MAMKGKLIVVEDAEPMNYHDIFAPVDAVFVEDGISTLRLGIFKTQFPEEQGLLRKHIKLSTTHLVASSWAAVCNKYPSDLIARKALKKHSTFHVVSSEWLCKSLKEGGLLMEYPFNLVPSKTLNSGEDAWKRGEELKAFTESKISSCEVPTLGSERSSNTILKGT